eukprot:6195550-Pleurochrysis_carterae.AAC.2
MFVTIIGATLGCKRQSKTTKNTTTLCNANLCVFERIQSLTSPGSRKVDAGYTNTAALVSEESAA